MLALLLSVAASCPSDQLTVFENRLAIVPPGSPLLDRALPPDAMITLYPVANASTATAAAILAKTGEILCEGPIQISRNSFRSPVDGSSLDEPLRQPVLAPFKGVTNEGADQEARIARIYDMATFKSVEDARLPVRRSPPQVVNVPGGAALSFTLEADAFGTTDRAFGPILRLNFVATATDAPAYRPAVTPYLLLSPSTSVRLMLDEDED